MTADKRSRRSEAEAGAARRERPAQQTTIRTTLDRLEAESFGFQRTAQCARKLLELRAHAGKTQKQLAARLRMTESMISRLERGDHVPSLKTLCRIADAFGQHLEIVFHEHEHVHADGTRHVHPHSHYDPEHQHDHGGEK